jgi:hypothetical protein
MLIPHSTDVMEVSWLIPRLRRNRLQVFAHTCTNLKYDKCHKHVAGVCALDFRIKPTLSISV